MEAVRLRVKDVELHHHELIVRSGKGDKDRVTVLPVSLSTALAEQLQRRRQWFVDDLVAGKVYVWLPDALAVKYPSAPKD